MPRARKLTRVKTVMRTVFSVYFSELAGGARTRGATACFATRHDGPEMRKGGPVVRRCNHSGLRPLLMTMSTRPVLRVMALRYMLHDVLDCVYDPVYQREPLIPKTLS